MVDAKTGAVRLASKLSAPSSGVFPRRKRVFSRMDIIIGDAYYVRGSSHDEYEQLAEEIMEHIYALRDGESA